MHFVWLFFTVSLAHGAIELAVEANPDPVRPGETVNVSIIVANTGQSAASSVSVQMQWVGDHLNNLGNTLISDGGACPGTSCNSSELVTWTLGTLNTGETRTVSLPPVVWSGTPVGELLAFNSSVTEDGDAQSISNNTVFVGENFTIAADPPIGGDFDSDGDVDFTDLFTFEGWFFSGDSKGDFDQDGDVDFSDLFIFEEYWNKANPQS